MTLEVDGEGSSSTGLTPRVGAVLAYGGWWITGLVFWWIERRDAYVRFHAAQSVVAFGLVAFFVIGFGAMALLSLSFLPGAFTLFMWAAGMTWVAGMVLCAAAMLTVASGRMWRMPVAGPLAERLVARSR